MEKTINVLLVEDNPGDVRLIQEMLKESSSSTFRLEYVDHLSKGIDRLKKAGFDVILLDLSLPDSSGIATLERMIGNAPSVPIVVLTGQDDEDLAINAMHKGLQDYIVKGNLNGELLIRSIRYAIERKGAEEELRMARDELDARVKERTRELSEANISLREEISERIKAEKALKEAKAQTELYVDLMGHDINNINQIVIGFIELALEDQQLKNETKILLTKPLEVLNKSTKLINNVSKLQRIKSDTLQRKPIDLGSVLTNIKEEHLYIPGKKITINYEHVRGCRVIANELLTDVFENLVSNSIKHSAADEAVIDIKITKVNSDNGKKYYQVSVDDNGPGIPDMLKDKVFDRHLRGTTRAKGSGIGLYLVKNLIDYYDGKVWAEDRIPGDHTKGVRFVVMLPAIEC